MFTTVPVTNTAASIVIDNTNIIDIFWFPVVQTIRF
jgi:hypothetical protein